jgi:hypothetical protein
MKTIRRLIVDYTPWWCHRHTYAAGPVAGYVAWHTAPLIGLVAFEATDGSLTVQW